MANDSFVHLHNHSVYSLLDGFIDIDELLNTCKETNMPAVAVTDHGNLHGMYKFYTKAVAAGVKPIIGMEAYMCASKMSTKIPENKDNYHQLIWVKDNVGLQNLYRLSTIAYTEGFYGKPRIDFEALDKYREGLIVTSSCLAGLAPQSVLDGDEKKAQEYLSKYKEVFGDDFYLEVQFNGLEDQNKVNDFMKKMSNKLKIEMVVTADAHYLKEEDWEHHDVVLAMQTKQKLSDEKRFKFPGRSFYIHTPEEMKKLSSTFPGAYDNTVKIADKCDVKIKRDGWIFPKFEGYSDEWFINKCVEDLKNRLRKKNIPDDQKAQVWEKYKTRLDYELSVILKQGYGPYFAVVADYCGWARSKDILMSPARGSAGGCLVSYVTEISDIDPVQYNLPFERFLNPERVSPPDIDSDFQDDRREEVIEYLRTKYGADCVAQVAKFGTVGAKSAIRDVARVLGYPLDVVDSFAEILPLELEKRGHILDLNDILKSKETLAAIEKNKEFKHIFKYVKRIAGIEMVNNVGVNASGIIITDKPIMEYAPLFFPPKTKADGSSILCTQWDKIDVEERGLIKFDILGLKTLTVIDKTIKLVEKRTGKKLPRRIEEYNLDDQEVYSALHNWDKLTGCFQIEKDDFLPLIKQLKPTNIDGISDISALWRPGPRDTGLVEEYIEAKTKGTHKPYVHESVKSFMEQTANTMIYQEQVMNMARALAGYSLGEADMLRRAIGKKDMDKMKALRSGFVEKCIGVGIIDKQAAEDVFSDFEKYSDYAFNSSHSMAYSLNTYWTMWLRHYYPKEFLTSLMNVYLNNEDDMGRLVKEAMTSGIKVKMPDFRYSTYECTIEDDNTIRIGFGAILGVGDSVDKFVDYYRSSNLDMNNFTLIHSETFGRKDQMSKRYMEALIFAGAFDYIGVGRDRLFATYEFYEENVTKKYKNKDYQLRLAFMKEAGLIPEDMYEKIPVGDLETKQMELMPFKSYGSKLDGFEDILYNTLKLSSIDSVEANGRIVKVPGIISSVKTLKDKNKKEMAFITIEDPFGAQMRGTIFAYMWPEVKELVQIGKGIVVEGKAEEYNGRLGFKISRVSSLKKLITMATARMSVSQN